MGKDLKEKAISIKGKQYVLVSDRVLYFNEVYKNGSIQTERYYDENTGREIFKAIVVPDMDKPERIFTGYSQAIWGDGYINKNSAMENAETSAVGRALAFLGIGVIDSIASPDEINKAENQNAGQTKTDRLREAIESASTIDKLMELQPHIAKTCVSDKQKQFFENLHTKKYKELNDQSDGENLAEQKF